jgi:AraC-like DNA-binding protein
MISRYGGDPERVLHAAQLSARDVLNPDALLGLSDYCALFERAAEQTGVDSFGLRFGRHYRFEDMGPLALLALNAPTLGVALKHMCRYFPAVQEHSSLSLQADGDVLQLNYQIRDGRIAARRQDAELSIAIFLGLFQRSLGAGWAPEQIHFEHARAADPGEHRKLLGAPVYFAQQHNAILFRRPALGQPMPGANPAAIPGLQAALAAKAAAARQDDFIGQVTQEIRTGIGMSALNIETIAARLGMSRTRLYRQLAARGLEFSALSQTIRQEMALLYTAQPHIPLTEIAALLGYSELSAFSRAFRRWSGMSPATYRARKMAALKLV